MVDALQHAKDFEGFGVAVIALWIVWWMIKFMTGILKDHKEENKGWREEVREGRKQREENHKEITVVLKELTEVIRSVNKKK